MIFNDVDFRSLVKVLRVTKEMIPPVTTNYTRVPDRDDALIARQEMGVLYIYVDIGLKTKTKEELVDLERVLAGLLYTKEPKKLILTKEPDKYYKAILSGPTMIHKFRRIGEARLQFMCADPIAYGRLIDGPIDGERINQGTYPSKALITITLADASDHVQATLVNTGEYIRIEDDFDEGDIVAIDCEDQSVKKNGHLIMDKLTLESDFFEIPPGPYKITISPSDNARVEYRERWI